MCNKIRKLLDQKVQKSSEYLKEKRKEIRNNNS